MRRSIAIITLIIIGFVGLAFAANEETKSSQSDFGENTVATFTDTAKSTLKGTEKIAKTSVDDIGATPEIAIQAVKDTANTALDRADAALKNITGEDKQ